jgi:hypothetical protein
VANFGGGAAGFDGAAGVAVDGAFELAADCNAEFYEGAGFGVERTGFGGGASERVVGSEDFRVIFLEFEVAAGEFSRRRRFGFAHGTEGCGFVGHPQEPHETRAGWIDWSIEFNDERIGGGSGMIGFDGGAGLR